MPTYSGIQLHSPVLFDYTATLSPRTNLTNFEIEQETSSQNVTEATQGYMIVWNVMRVSQFLLLIYESLRDAQSDMIGIMVSTSLIGFLALLILNQTTSEHEDYRTPLYFCLRAQC